MVIFQRKEESVSLPMLDRAVQNHQFKLLPIKFPKL